LFLSKNAKGEQVNHYKAMQSSKEKEVAQLQQTIESDSALLKIVETEIASFLQYSFLPNFFV